MVHRFFRSLQSRLNLLVLLAMLPAFGMILYVAETQRTMAAQTAASEALHLARLFATRQTVLTDTAHQLLTMVAQVPLLRTGDTAACNALLADLIRQPHFSRYTVLGVYRPDGTPQCSSFSAPNQLNLADRPFFQAALQTRQFTPGLYTLGRITGKQVMSYAYPILHASGEVQLILTAALDLGWFDELAANSILPDGSAFGVLDGQGVVLTRYPAIEGGEGQVRRDVPIVQTILSARGEGTAEAPGVDGVKRLYAYTPLFETSGPPTYVFVGIPSSVALAPSNALLWRHLGGLGLATLVSLLATRLFGGWFILRGMTALLRGTQALAAGDLSTRVRLDNDSGEIAELAHAFDQMADALQKREGQFRDAEHRYRALFEEAPIMYVTTRNANEEPIIADCNAMFLSTLGYTRSEVLGRSLAEFYTAASQALLRGGGYQRGLEGDLMDEERQLLTTDGRVVDTLMRSFPEQGPDSLVIGTRATYVDITLRKQIEEQIKHSARRAQTLAEIGQPLAEAIQDYQAVLHTIARHTSELIGDACTIRVVSADGQWLEIVAAHHPDPVGLEVLWDITRAHPQGTHDGYAGQAIQLGKPVIVPVIDQAQLRAIKRPSNHTYVEQFGIHSLMIAPLRARGQILGLLTVTRDRPGRPYTADDLAFLQDVADRAALALSNAHLYEALQERSASLERSNRDLQEFAYIASHDLQEPLRMVSSYVQLLARRYRGKLDADADEFIAYAVDGASRMQRLINDLLIYSRVDTRGTPPKPTNIESTLSVVLLNLGQAIAESQAVITHDPLPTVIADEGQLVQVFQNLLGNAIKFRGDRTPRIHIGATVRDGQYIFSVHDNGIGLKAEDADRIFVLFQRLHTRADYPGTGIGLAVSKKIIERHGGRIWVESSPDQGSTFYFTLPLPKGELTTETLDVSYA